MMIPTKDTPYDVFIGSLVIDFPKDNIPQSTDIDDWRKSASLLAQENSFSANGTPSPYGFKEKIEWAQAVFYSMSSFS